MGANIAALSALPSDAYRMTRSKRRLAASSGDILLMSVDARPALANGAAFPAIGAAAAASPLPVSCWPATKAMSTTTTAAAIVHACTIEDECLIGMGATVLDGAEIGARSIVGANALVPQGLKVPPGSMVYGSPAKVVRTLDDASRAKFLESAHHYVENGRRYLAGLKPVEG